MSRTVNVTKTGGLTEDGRRRISESLKLRWKDEEYRKRYVTAAGRNVTAETREKISKAIKLKWQDVEYRAKCMSGNITLEQRQRISSTLKERWRTDEDFKTRMRNNLTHPKTEAWKAAVSQKIKDRWNDPEYRSKIVKSNRTRTYNESDLNAKQLTQKKKKLPSDSSQAKASIKASREKIARSVQSKTQQIATKLLREAQKSSKEDVYAAAKRECRLGMQMSSTRTVREMLGEEFWAEEKLQRAATAKGGIVDDMTLELTLISEWSRESVPPEVLANVLELSAVDDDNRSEKSIQDKLVDVDNATAKPQSSVSSKKSKAGSKRGTEEADDDSDAPVDGDDEDEDEGDYVIEYMGH